MSVEFRLWMNGESGYVTYAGRCVPMRVLMASQNGRSLMIEFEALLGGYAGRMPVLWEGQFRDLIAGLPVLLTKEEPSDGVSTLQN